MCIGRPGEQLCKMAISKVPTWMLCMAVLGMVKDGVSGASADRHASRDDSFNMTSPELLDRPRD